MEPVLPCNSTCIGYCFVAAVAIGIFFVINKVYYLTLVRAQFLLFILNVTRYIYKSSKFELKLVTKFGATHCVIFAISSTLELDYESCIHNFQYFT